MIHVTWNIEIENFRFKPSGTKTYVLLLERGKMRVSKCTIETEKKNGINRSIKSKIY